MDSARVQGSPKGFKPRPKSDADIRPIPLGPLVVEAIRRQLPPGNDPQDLVFTRPGRRPRPRRDGMPRGARTVLSRHNFHRTYHAALAKLTDPTGELRPTAGRALKALRGGGPQTVDELTVAVAKQGRAIRSATVQIALAELVAADLVSSAGEDGQQRWRALPTIRDPLLETVDLRGCPRLPPHLRHLAGGRRHPGPGHRRADGARGHRSQ
jgi:hypothetical protein